MTIPLQVLAVGAILAGFVGVPAALYGNNAIEHFLEPSFTASSASAGEHTSPAPTLGDHAAASPTHETGASAHGASIPVATRGASPAEAPEGGEGGEHMSRLGEIGLMLFSLVVAITGILVAYRFYVKAPEISERLAVRFAGPHKVLYNKYYVDELYDATAIAGTMAAGRGLWAFDSKVVDGAVNGTGWLTLAWSWLSHQIDKYAVDGTVNFVGTVLEEGSYVFRRLQTGLIQNYALVMLFGVFAFVSIYLFTK